MTLTSIPPRSRTHRSASSSSHHVRCPTLSLALTSTDQNNLSWNSRCVCIVILVIFYPTATLNLLTMLLDHYAKSVYVPSKDVYFVALYYYYGKFTEMTPFEKNMLPIFLESIVPKCTTTCHALAISHTIK